ncbi:MAG TPA: ABC transporter ATP-binding protein [Chloroflexia bacterium]|nr:ABC transporter ATP-binding protein [Chloroflexia bacterium]
MQKVENLELRGVTRRFGATTALSNFNLKVNGGSFVSLLGPSGCGKSTALNCLAGLLDLSEGEILVNGKPVQNLPAEKRGFGMVFQNYALFPHLTAARNVAYGLELRKVPKAEREQRVQKALEMVHLEEYGKRFPAQLSGGQQQRLAIARTLVLEPTLLLLDEPLSNLDTKLRNEMRIEIKHLHEKLGLTTIYVTHDQSEAMSLSDLVVVMRLGRIEQIGVPQEIYRYPKSLYVANFMGYSSRMNVKVLGKEGNRWQVETISGIRLLGTAPAETAWQPGQQVVACFRPDDALITPSPTANPLQAEVVLVEYLGKSFEVLVRLAGQAQELLVHSFEPLEGGLPVSFGVNPDRLLLFEPEDVSSEGTQVAVPEMAVKGGR